MRGDTGDGRFGSLAVREELIMPGVIPAAAHHYEALRLAPRLWSVSAPVVRGAVLLCHAGRDAAALIDRDAAVFRPGPDVTGVLPAGHGTPRPALL